MYHDLLGMMQHPHHAKVTPKFCKQYASLGIQIEQALRAFNQEVKHKSFPSAAHTPYKIAGELSLGVQENFCNKLTTTKMLHRLFSRLLSSQIAFAAIL